MQGLFSKISSKVAKEVSCHLWTLFQMAQSLHLAISMPFLILSSMARSMLCSTRFATLQSFPSSILALAPLAPSNEPCPLPSLLLGPSPLACHASPLSASLPLSPHAIGWTHVLWTPPHPLSDLSASNLGTPLFKPQHF